RSWRVFALDRGSASVLAGWPLETSDATVSPINENGPAQFQRTGKMSQRGALNLSLDRTVLYVPFGSYIDGGAGWLVAVDTGLPSGCPPLARRLSGPPWVEPGGKQGNAYLIDRDNMGGRLDHRPDCNLTYSAADRSLFGPELYSHYGNLPGPLNLFGPYSEEYNDISLAKARSTPAFYRAADETPYLFFTGSTKKCVSCADPASPGVARVKLIAATGQPAYLALDAYENTLVL